MFGYLSGNILAIEGIVITLEVRGTGLGFDIYTSPSVLSEALTSKEISLWIHHHKTDMSELLFGFKSVEERSLFRELLKVNGVGGKTALNILGLGRESILRAIQFEDDSILSSVPGIGKKTAQKIIVDLKGSIDFSKKQEKENTKNHSDIELISSLVQMGYDKSRVEKILKQLDPTITLEVKTIEAIKLLSK